MVQPFFFVNLLGTSNARGNFLTNIYLDVYLDSNSMTETFKRLSMVPVLGRL